MNVYYLYSTSQIQVDVSSLKHLVNAITEGRPLHL